MNISLTTKILMMLGALMPLTSNSVENKNSTIVSSNTAITAPQNIANLPSETQTGLISQINLANRTISVGTKDYLIHDPLIVQDSKGQLANRRFLIKGARIQYTFINNDALSDTEQELQNIESPDPSKPYVSQGLINRIIILSKTPEQKW